MYGLMLPAIALGTLMGYAVMCNGESEKESSGTVEPRGGGVLCQKDRIVHWFGHAYKPATVKGYNKHHLQVERMAIPYLLCYHLYAPQPHTVFWRNAFTFS
eukprot:5664605-Pyramimonas_sp.AAC.1